MSRPELAYHFGVHARTIQDWELGNVVPQQANSQRLAEWIDSDGMASR